MGLLFSNHEMYIGTKCGNVVKARSAVRVVERSKRALIAIQHVSGTPNNLRPAPDDERLTADDTEGVANPHD